MIDRIHISLGVSLHYHQDLDPSKIKAAVKRYLGLLSALQRGGVLGERIVYIPCGWDFFPSMFERTYGINMNSIENPDFFIENFGKYFDESTRSRASQIRRNLIYCALGDAKDIELLRRALAKAGFLGEERPTSLFLKGTVKDLFRLESEDDKYVSRPSSVYLPRFRKWMVEISKLLLKDGDYIVVFDGENEVTPILLEILDCQEVKVPGVRAPQKRGDYVYHSIMVKQWGRWGYYGTAVYLSRTAIILRFKGVKNA